MGAPLLEIRSLTVDYGTGRDAVRAVNEVDLTIHRGEILGLAGESGSGKSTLANALTRLLRPPATVVSGQVLFTGGSGTPIDVLQLGPDALRRFRWQEVAIVFQSAMNALNPVITVREHLVDTLRSHRRDLPRKAAEQRAGELLDIVGVSRDRLRSYSHQLSGGMRQRVMIAMALALNPRLLIMDEPTTALDVVTQSQIIEQLIDLRDQFGFSMLFITHDLSLLLEVADSIAVMYAGRVVERDRSERIYRESAHPYTRGLIGSFPPLTGARRELHGIPGSPPDLAQLPEGCAFEPRCPYRLARCVDERPPLLPTGDTGVAACWLIEEGRRP
ncbi:MAG: ABC transporter ATP-binding protein [Acidimicrobiales bacterium]